MTATITSFAQVLHEATQLELWSSMGTMEVAEPAIAYAESLGHSAIKAHDELVEAIDEDPSSTALLFVLREDYSEESKLTKLLSGHDEIYDAVKLYNASASDENVIDYFGIFDVSVRELVLPSFFRSESGASLGYRVLETSDSTYIVSTMKRSYWESTGREEYLEIANEKQKHI